MPSLIFSRLAALAAMATIAVSGCSSDTAGSAVSSDAAVPTVVDVTTIPGPVLTTPTGAPDAATAPAVTTGSAVTPPDASIPTSPLDALLGHVSDPTELLRIGLEGQRLIAACMADLGWEYSPVSMATNVLGPADAPIGSTAFGERYGYGVVAQFEGSSGQGPLAPAPTVDPNTAYIASLTPTEQTEYEVALHGKMQGEAATGGCDQQALTLYPPQPANTIAGLFDRVIELQGSIRLDPRMQAANATWLACVTAAGPIELAGRSVSEPSEMTASVQAELDLARGLETYPIDLDNTPADIVSSNVFADGTWFGAVGTASPVDPATLERLRVRELALFSADQQCQQSAGIAAARASIEAELVEQLHSEFPELSG